jgi:cysteinyl-tRNA synthetase
MMKLNMLKPTYEPKVSDNIDSIIETINKILLNKSAYISEKHVIFDTGIFFELWRLSPKK